MNKTNREVKRQIGNHLYSTELNIKILLDVKSKIKKPVIHEGMRVQNPWYLKGFS